MSDDFMLRQEIKALHQKQLVVEREIAERARAADIALQSQLEPLYAEFERLGRKMDALLGETKSWVVGRYGEDGLPIFQGDS